MLARKLDPIEMRHRTQAFCVNAEHPFLHIRLLQYFEQKSEGDALWCIGIVGHRGRLRDRFVTTSCCSGPIAAPSYYRVGFCTQLRAVSALYVAFNRGSRWFHSIVTPRGKIVNAGLTPIGFTLASTAIHSPLSAIPELCRAYRNATRQRRGHPAHVRPHRAIPPLRLAGALSGCRHLFLMGSGVPASAQGTVMDLVPPSSVPTPPVIEASL